MKSIAQDEVLHAELAWAVAHWLDGRLDSSARARVQRARARAVETLVRTASGADDPELIAQLGLPTPSEARAIALNLASTVWS